MVLVREQVCCYKDTLQAATETRGTVLERVAPRNLTTQLDTTGRVQEQGRYRSLAEPVLRVIEVDSDKGKGTNHRHYT